ncbi:MAG: UDP-glucose/GDP-mannose dehydrogenase family protein [Myxococcota bacterium]|nr:UDP-glucose/GDP-mannose dehydrogenase family protein [Myxococcota bacterium]
MRITVIGSGYVGLVVGACLADAGNQVICADIDQEKVARLRRAEVPFFEPGLDTVVGRNLEAGRLQFTTEVEAACRQGAVIFIAVGTPQGDDGSAELRFVHSVADTIGDALSGGENELEAGQKLILTKSTVPIGTTDAVSERVAARATIPFVVCSNPEFLKEGDALNDFLKPDRVVIGVPEDDSGLRAEKTLRRLYAPFCRTRDRLLVMNVRSSEMTKYAANALLATKISFMNDLSNLAERVGADIDRVRVGIGSDPRIGYPFLFAGTGYGGSCFPKDVKALTHIAEQAGHSLEILESVDRVNQRQKGLLLRKAERYFSDKEGLKGKRFAVWGLAFKPRTDDMREAPSITLIRGLLSAGAEVRAYDPEAVENAKRVFTEADEQLIYCEDQYQCLENADALFVVTEWRLFHHPDWERVSRLLSRKLIFDGRNLYKPDHLGGLGYQYYGVGRGSILPV